MRVSEDAAVSGVARGADLQAAAATRGQPAAASPRQPQEPLPLSHASPVTLLAEQDVRGGSSGLEHGGNGSGNAGDSRPQGTGAAAGQPAAEQAQEQELPSSSSGGKQALLDEGNGGGAMEAEVAAMLMALPDRDPAGALPPPAAGSCPGSPPHPTALPLRGGPAAASSRR